MENKIKCTACLRSIDIDKSVEMPFEKGKRSEKMSICLECAEIMDDFAIETISQLIEKINEFNPRS